MAHFNKMIVLGRLTRDPCEVKTLPNGNSVIDFGLACGQSRKDKSTGQWIPDPNPLFIDCKVWAYADSKRNLVKVVEQYLRKGGEVLLEGSAKTESWEDKNGGGKRSKTVLFVTEIQLLGGKKDDSAGGESQSESAPAAFDPNEPF